MPLNKRSRDALKGVHPDLVRVVERAADIGPPFIVTEGLRTPERQKMLKASGKSRTLKSRHLTGHAVDLADAKATYKWSAMQSIADTMKQAAKDEGVPITWGGDWKTFKDTPHFELPPKVYPAVTNATWTGKTEAPSMAENIANKITKTEKVKEVAEKVTETSKHSRTITGVLLAALGTVVQYMEQGFAILMETAAKVSEWSPVEEMLTYAGAHGKSVGFGLAAAGLTLALWRRIDAGIKGKIG